MFGLGKMALRLFFDSFSQPCRAVMLLLEANKIPYQKVVVNIGKGIHGMDLLAPHLCAYI